MTRRSLPWGWSHMRRSSRTPRTHTRWSARSSRTMEWFPHRRSLISRGSTKRRPAAHVRGWSRVVPGGTSSSRSGGTTSGSRGTSMVALAIEVLAVVLAVFLGSAAVLAGWWTGSPVICTLGCFDDKELDSVSVNS